jgi:hypothetical protein
MRATDPTVLEALDLRIPDVPKRSRLFALPPLGVGTDVAESLSSYLVRLARAHAVNPRHLLREEFQPLAVAPLRRLARHADEVASMNGYGAHAQVFADITAQLTTRPEVRYLTLLPLSDLLPRNGCGVVAAQPRWCPECLAEMVQARQEPRRPLVWALALYTVCHRHRRPLVAACQNCKKGQPFLPTYPDLTHCAHCGAALQVRQKVSKSPKTTVALWNAESLAELVAQLPGLDGMADRGRFLEFLDAAIERHAGGNRAAFCRAMGVRPGIFKDWYRRSQRPSLPQLMVIAHGMRIGPAAMFLPHAAASVQLQRTKSATGRRSRASLEVDGARRLALASLAAIAADPEDRRSLFQVAHDLHLTMSFLRYWCPVECSAICRKHSDAEGEELVRRRTAEHKIVAGVVREVIGRGQYPGRRKVNEILGRLHLSLAQPDMVQAYRMAVRDFWPSERSVAN